MVDVVVGMHVAWLPGSASECCRHGEITSLTFHVELGAASRIQTCRGNMSVMLAGHDLVTGRTIPVMTLIASRFTHRYCDGGGFLQGGVSRDHLAGKQVFPC